MYVTLQHVVLVLGQQRMMEYNERNRKNRKEPRLKNIDPTGTPMHIEIESHPLIEWYIVSLCAVVI